MHMIQNSEQRFLVYKNGQQLGPYDKQRVMEYLEAGHLTLDDQVCTPGMKRWEPLRYHLSGEEMSRLPQTQNPKGSPIHILTALVVMALDTFWSVFQIVGYITIVGIVVVLALSFVIGAVAYFVTKNIQMNSAGDTQEEAHPKALAMAVLCGVPFPFLGTIAGGFFLTYAGLKGSRTRLLRN